MTFIIPTPLNKIAFDVQHNVVIMILNCTLQLVIAITDAVASAAAMDCTMHLTAIINYI